MRRAFSLFTPLVGTSVIILTIMMTSIMVLNDTRMARGLMNSYEYSSEANAGALIKAAAQLKMMQNIENLMNEYFNDTFSFTCTGTTTCFGRVNTKLNSMIGSKGELARSILLPSGGLYNGVLDNLETVTDYTVQHPIDKGNAISNSLNTYSLPGQPDFLSVGFEAQGKPNVTMETGGINDENFSVTFEKASNTITVSILPDDGLTYVYGKGIKKKFNQSASNFDAFLNNVITAGSDEYWKNGGGCNTLEWNSAQMGSPAVIITPYYSTTLCTPSTSGCIPDTCSDKPSDFTVKYVFNDATLDGNSMVIEYSNHSSSTGTTYATGCEKTC